MTQSQLILALPSKGRLMERTVALFEAADLAVEKTGHERGYRGAIRDLEGVSVAYLSASEIARNLKDGEVHLGITGEDLLRENIPSLADSVTIEAALGFGRADVVVAVPESWLDVHVMADLEDVGVQFHARHGRRLRVATKYVRLSRGFFAAHGVFAYRIVESAGATEGAPASGAAQAIVDITSTGSTLRANHLKILDDGLILRSEANLVRAKSARWDAGTRSLADDVIGRVRKTLNGGHSGG